MWIKKCTKIKPLQCNLNVTVELQWFHLLFVLQALNEIRASYKRNILWKQSHLRYSFNTSCIRFPLVATRDRRSNRYTDINVFNFVKKFAPSLPLQLISILFNDYVTDKINEPIVMFNTHLKYIDWHIENTRELSRELHVVK